MNSLRKILKEVNSTQDFSLLDPLRDSSQWSDIQPKDRAALAELFVQCGRRELEDGAIGPLPTFEIAQRLDPENGNLLLEQANLYASFGDALENLSCAAEVSSAAEGLVDTPFYPMMTWANVTVELGVRKEDPNFFAQANAKYEQIDSIDDIPDDEVSQFYWHWGICWHYVAKQSGEAIDFVTALSKYREAEVRGLDEPMFLNDYGNALVDLACLVSREDLLAQASKLYRRVVEQLPEFFEGVMNLACTDHQLWQINRDDDYFRSAVHCFETGSKLEEDEAALWFKWAQILFHAGKENGDTQMIIESLEKFLKANTLHPDHASVLSEWAEAYLCAGVLQEKLEYLKWAQELILRAIEIEPENSEHWTISGRVLIELGRYFEDEVHFESAIEKLNTAISLHPSDPHLWYGLATSYHVLSDMKGEPPLCEKAVKYYSRVTEFDGEMTPEFWNEWGVALMKMGGYSQDKRWVEAASEKFEQSIRLYYLLHDPSTINPTWLYNYGTALDFLGDFTQNEKYYEKAIKVLSQALTLDPTHYRAKNHLATCFAHLGEIVSDVDCFEKSLELFAEVLEEDPEDEIAWMDWGLALMNLAELVRDPVQSSYADKLMHQAEEKLMRSASLGNEISFYYLACLYALLDRSLEAFHYLERSKHARYLPPLEELLHEEWLSNIRSTPRFQEFIRDLD